MAKNNHIHYRDIGNIFLDTDNKEEKSLMNDSQHPNVEGHMLMFKALEKDLTHLMSIGCYE